MEAEDISSSIEAIRGDVVNGVITEFVPVGSIEEQWEVDKLGKAIEQEFGLSLDINRWLEEDEHLHEETLRARILEEIVRVFQEKEQKITSEIMRRFEKDVMLQILDNHWKEHLAAMDYLRQGIGLRGYAQKDPKQEYKREAFKMFQQLLDRIKHDVICLLAKVQVHSEQELEAMEEESRQPHHMQYEHEEAHSALNADSEQPIEKEQPFRRQGRKIGRNEPCYCGSGKKYKHCHGKLS
jgi:preprotein translocase subunit SecA